MTDITQQVAPKNTGQDLLSPGKSGDPGGGDHISVFLVPVDGRARSSDGRRATLATHRCTRLADNHPDYSQEMHRSSGEEGTV